MRLRPAHPKNLLVQLSIAFNVTYSEVSRYVPRIRPDFLIDLNTTTYLHAESPHLFKQGELFFINR